MQRSPLLASVRIARIAKLSLTANRFCAHGFADQIHSDLRTRRNPRWRISIGWLFLELAAALFGTEMNAAPAYCPSNIHSGLESWPELTCSLREIKNIAPRSCILIWDKARIAAMDLVEAIHGRRSTRAFTSQSVSGAVLQKLIDAAIHAPSAVNLQPWHFTVVRNAGLMDRISASSKNHMLAGIREGKNPEAFEQHLKDPNFHIFYHAPVLVVISARTVQWGTEDVALAAENLMLAAHGEGLGTCWIGFAQQWLATEEGKRLIEVAPDCMPIAPIIVGYPHGLPPAVARNPPIIHWID